MDAKVLFNSFREVNQRFVELLDSLSALRALAEIPTREQTETVVLENALRTLMDNQDFARSCVFLRDGATLHYGAGLDWQSLLTGEAVDADVSCMLPAEFALGDDIFGQVARSRMIETIEDCTTDPRITSLIKEGSKPVSGALLCGPISAGEDLLGILVVHHPRENFFSNAHFRTLALFCSFLGQILANFRYAKQMENIIHERTVQLQNALNEAEDLKIRYQQLAIIDDLTQLNNRRFFLYEASTTVARAARHGDAFTLLLLDLDQYNKIVETHGHALGDRVLVDSAALIKEQIRYGDILACFGGERFALALPQTPIVGANDVANRMLSAIRGVEWEMDGTPVRATASIGIAGLPIGAKGSPEDLLNMLIGDADRALQLAKQQGRDRVQIFNPQ